MELGAVLTLRDKLSATMEKASKAVGGMTKRVNEARGAIEQMSDGSDITINARSNLSNVVAFGRAQIGKLEQVISDKQLTLHAQFGDESFDLSTIDGEINKVSGFLEQNIPKVDEYRNKLELLTQKQSEFSSKTKMSTKLGMEQQLDSLKEKLADIEAAKQVFAEWKQIRLEYNDLQKVQAEVSVLEQALRNINSTNVAVRAYINWKNDALKQVYDIDEHLSTLGKKVFSPIVSLKEKVSGKLSSINAHMKDFAGKIFSPVVSIVDKTKAVLPKVRSALGKIAGTMAYPVIKVKDLATAAVQKVSGGLKAIGKKVFSPIVKLKDAASSVLSKVTGELKKIGGKIFSPIIKIADKISEPVKKIGSTLKSITSKAWHATVAAKDKLSGVLGGIKSKVLNLKTLLSSLVVGGAVGKGLQATVGGAMQLENQQVSMKHFIGTTNKGMSEADVQKTTNAFIQQLRANANATPFETGDVIAAGSRAVAVASGNTKEAMNLVKLAEDMAAASGGTKTIGDAVEALADAKLGETERLKEFGFKVSKEEFDAKGFSGVTNDLNNFFGGAAEKLATTGAGLISTIKGSTKSALTDMGKDGLEKLKPELSKLADMMTDEDFMGGIVEKGSEMVSKVVGIGLKVVNFFKDNWKTIEINVKSVWTQVQPIVSLFSKTFDGLKKILQGVFTGKKPNISQIMPSTSDVSAAINSLIGMVYKIAPSIINGIASGFSGIAVVIASQTPQLVSAGVKLIGVLLSAIISNLPQFSQAAVNIILALGQGLISLLPTLSSSGMQILQILLDSINANLPAILSCGVQLVMMLIQGLSRNLAQISQMALTLIVTLAQGLLSNLPLIARTLLLLLDSFSQTIISYLPLIIQLASQILMSLCQGLLSMLPHLLTTGFQLIISLAQSILSQLPLILQIAVQLVIALCQGLLSMLPQIIQMGIQLIISLFQGIIQNLPIILQSAAQIVITLAMGLIQAIPQLVAAIPQLVMAIIDTIIHTNWLQVGWDIIKGIFSGLWEGAKSMFSGIWDGIKGLLGFGGKDAGEAAAAGVEQGLNNGMPSVNAAASNVAADATTNLMPNMTTISGYGTDASNYLATGISSSGYLPSSAASGVASNTTASFNGATNTMSYGMQASSNLAAGINANAFAATSSASMLADNTKLSLSGITDTTQIGAGLCGNLAAGIDANSSTALTAASSMSNQVAGAAGTDVVVNIKVSEDSAVSFENSVKAIVTSATETLNQLPLLAENTMTAVTESVKAGMDGVRKIVVVDLMSIIAAVQAVSLYSAGQSIMDGLNLGILSRRRILLKTAHEIAQAISGTINQSLDINSPSRVMRQSGRFTGEGLALGMADTVGQVRAAAANLGQTTKEPFDKPEPPPAGKGGNYDGLVIAAPVSSGGSNSYTTNSNTSTATSTQSVMIQNLIGHVTVQNEADENRLVQKIIAALADDIDETKENMGEEDSN